MAKILCTKVVRGIVKEAYFGSSILGVLASYAHHCAEFYVEEGVNSLSRGLLKQNTAIECVNVANTKDSVIWQNSLILGLQLRITPVRQPKTTSSLGVD